MKSANGVKNVSEQLTVWNKMRDIKQKAWYCNGEIENPHDDTMNEGSRMINLGKERDGELSHRLAREAQL